MSRREIRQVLASGGFSLIAQPKGRNASPSDYEKAGAGSTHGSTTAPKSAKADNTGKSSSTNR